MLREVKKVLQTTPGLTKSWFTDEVFDLFVWQDDGGSILTLQLSYDKKHKERNLSWSADRGYGHHGVDDGEDKLGRIKASPIFVADGLFDVGAVARLFDERSADLDAGIRDFVARIIREYPGAGGVQ